MSSRTGGVSRNATARRGSATKQRKVRPGAATTRATGGKRGRTKAATESKRDATSLTASEVRSSFRTVLDGVLESRDIVLIRRPGTREAVVMVAEDEWESMRETAYLLRAPANVRHLFRALDEIEKGDVVEFDPSA